MMIYENDEYMIPEEVLAMSLEEIERELEIAREEMNKNPERTEKLKNCRVKFNFG